jgi:hypothetical protein
MEDDLIFAVFNLYTEKKVRCTKIPGLKFATAPFDEVFNALFGASQHDVAYEKEKNKKCAISVSNENRRLCITTLAVLTAGGDPGEEHPNRTKGRRCGLYERPYWFFIRAWAHYIM